MRNFSIDIVWAKVQMAFTVIGGWIGYFVGGVDGLMTALLIFMVLDYVTGLMCAIADKKLSSAVGFKGICKKVLIIMLVGVAHVVDLHVVGTGDARGPAGRCAARWCASICPMRAFPCWRMRRTWDCLSLTS